MGTMRCSFSAELRLPFDQAQEVRNALDLIGLKADWEASAPTFEAAFPGMEPPRNEDLVMSLFRNVVWLFELTSEDTINWPEDFRSLEFRAVEGAEDQDSMLLMKNRDQYPWASWAVAVGVIRACQEQLRAGPAGFTVRESVGDALPRTVSVVVTPSGNLITADADRFIERANAEIRAGVADREVRGPALTVENIEVAAPALAKSIPAMERVLEDEGEQSAGQGPAA